LLPPRFLWIGRIDGNSYPRLDCGYCLDRLRLGREPVNWRFRSFSDAYMELADFGCIPAFPRCTRKLLDQLREIAYGSIWILGPQLLNSR
jgi:hypothetical protein